MAEPITVADHIIPRFHPVLGDVMAHGHTHYWMPGGRGSTKSSFISIAIVLLIIMAALRLEGVIGYESARSSLHRRGMAV